MKIFPIKFNIGCIELDAIVTESDHDRRFKIEMVTGEHDPIVLKRTAASTWVIEHPGGRNIPAEGYAAMEKEIEDKLVVD